MKRKVGIVTIVHGENYGNRLQNYALQSTLEKLGYTPLTFRRNVYRNVLSQVKNTLGYMVKTIFQHRGRRIKFKRFNEDNIHFCNLTLYNRGNNINKGFSSFYAFICGSDQIWNPNWPTNSDVDFLMFAPRGKRIAYAASFGVEDIEEKDIPRYKRYLQELDYISVREKTGARIVYKLTNREVKVLADPTILISSDEWIELEKKPESVGEKKYILCYFLAGIDPSRKKQIQLYASEKLMDIIWIDNPDEKTSYDNGPGEFLFYIHHASHIFTDSFHCTVFSILYGREFDVFPRFKAGSRMSDRVLTLLEYFEMEDRYDRTYIDDASIDYKYVNERIRSIRKTSIDYLQESLDGVK